MADSAISNLLRKNVGAAWLGRGSLNKNIIRNYFSLVFSVDKRAFNVLFDLTLSKPEKQYFCIERFMDKPQDFEYLTGFVSYEHFQLLFRALGPAAHQLSYVQIKIFDPRK